MSKTWRLIQIARTAIEERQACETEILDLSRPAPRNTAGTSIRARPASRPRPPLCHWPCSCYPNYSLGQTQDWMNEIYPMWVAAHGVMIITPVHWYQVSSPLKLMMDRLVCADGGNPDPTADEGKNAKLAKEIELKGWSYPRHLDGRAFSVVVHGDVEGAGECPPLDLRLAVPHAPGAGGLEGRARSLHRLLRSLWRHQPRRA